MLSSFRASVCVNVEGPAFPEPEQVFGELTVFKGYFRLDCFLDEDELDEGEEAEHVSLIRTRDFEGAEIVKVHMDRAGVVRPLEEGLAIIQAEGPESADFAEKIRDSIRTFEMFHLVEALQEVRHAKEDDLAWPPSVSKRGNTCIATPFGDDGVRFVYVTDTETGLLRHIEQASEEDVAIHMRDALRQNGAPETPCSTYRVYMTLENTEKCNVDRNTFTCPSFYRSVNTMDESESANPSIPQDDPATQRTVVRVGPISGSIDMDDEIARPFNEFWKEFL